MQKGRMEEERKKRALLFEIHREGAQGVPD